MATDVLLSCYSDESSLIVHTAITYMVIMTTNYDFEDLDLFVVGDKWRLGRETFWAAFKSVLQSRRA